MQVNVLANKNNLAQSESFKVTVRTELHRHPAVATLSTYIHWKMEDDHTYHNRQVHDNTIHHMVLTTYFSMHVRNLSKVLYLLCLWCLSNTINKVDMTDRCEALKEVMSLNYVSY